MVEAIIKEITLKSEYLSGQEINTIYFGGGTPSLLTQCELGSIIDNVFKYFSISDKPEITLEANPEDLVKNKLIEIKNEGVNRLSIGVQSLSDQSLFQLNRTHNAKQSLDSIKLSKELGFENISVDLMFGLPNSDSKTWEHTLQNVINLDVQHISCYNLTVEERTALLYFVNKGIIQLPIEENQQTQYLLAHEMLSCSFYEHYEISNYARNGFQSMHNSNYWNRTAYLGIGPSAHSFIENRRFWNVANNTNYIKAISNNTSYYNTEVLSEVDQFNETIMLGLRKKEGVSKESLNTYNQFYSSEFKEKLKELKSNDHLLENETSYYLTPELLYLSDHICSQLFSLNS